MKPLCIYHGKCTDGFTAAWVVANAYAVANSRSREGSVLPQEAVELHAGVYGQEVPWDKVDGRLVVIVDFSYPEPVMREIVARARYVIWLDHHQTAIDDSGHLLTELAKKMTGRADVSRSGAWLAWEWFFPDEPVATMVKLVDDRDRWVFADDRTKPFNAYVHSRNYSFSEWDQLAASVPSAVEKGQVLLEDQAKKIDEIIQLATVWEEIDGHLVPSVNASHISASDACARLLDLHPDAPFAMSWFLRSDRRVVYSLRSRKGSEVDVGEIAKGHGGGGHKHAAGFAA